ncbi:MAG: hypothetical protein K2L07_16655 [Lachnospiraceae bacterium]|nr:hypothetical protein [Lachnospiraceae bacterium]
MKEEIDNELKAVEHSIIGYMTENWLDMEITDTAKITYRPQNRTSLDREDCAEDREFDVFISEQYKTAS